MQSDTQIAPASKKMLWTGRILSALPVLLMLGTGIPALVNPAPMQEGFSKYGYPPHYLRGIIVTEIVCVVLYAIPQTAVLGAILLTGYLGGATATHVRVSEPFFMPIIVGIVVWLGLFLRDPRVRALIPLRRSWGS
jgi:hypothetical protein